MSELNSIPAPTIPSPSVAPGEGVQQAAGGGGVAVPRPVRASRGSCPCCSALAAGCSYSPRSQVCPPVTSGQGPATRRCWPRRPDWFVLWVLVPHCVAVGPVRAPHENVAVVLDVARGGSFVEVWKSDSH